jgi:hypothetical protein
VSRNPETSVDPSGDGPTYAELLDLQKVEDGGRRILIPTMGRACVSWLRSGASQNVLVEIADPGQLRLLPWTPHGEAVLAREQELAKRRDPEALDELLILTERFRRVHFEKSSRFPVQEREQFHLGLSDLSGWRVLLICLPDEVQIWSEEYRRQWRSKIRFSAPWPIE